MSQLAGSAISEPVPISLVGGHYFIFDNNVATYLRRTHHICGTAIGNLPQNPQQNVFSGLPLELMPEEARLLVDKKAAFIIDDAAWHRDNFATKGPQKTQYVESIHTQGLLANKAAAKSMKERKEIGLKRALAAGALKPGSGSKESTELADNESLFHTERPVSRTSIISSTSNVPWPVTPTTTYPPEVKGAIKEAPPSVPSSYHLFAHLHTKGYFLWPGLRFGCNYNVYPGDPMRFHAHFAAVSYEWDEDISMIDLIGGGRLGTRVKKAFLIGGKDEDKSEEEGDNVRTFSIEWGGM